MKKTIAIATAVLLLAGAHTLSAQMTISNGQQTTTTKGVSPHPGIPTGNETPPAGFVKSVTPVSGCLDQLPPEEAAEVRTRYLKPYQECHRRLQIHAIKKAKAVKEGETEKQTQAESPRNFVRVQKDAAPTAPPVIGIKASNIPDKKEKTPGNYNR